MATRFYLPSSGSPVVSPTYVQGDNKTQADRVGMVLTKGATALTDKVVNGQSSGGGFYTLARQYISPLMQAHDFTTSETFGFAIRCMENNAGDNAYLAFNMFVCNGTTGAFVGYLYQNYIGLEETVGALTGIGQASVALGFNTSMSEGDCIVVEILHYQWASDGARDLTFNFGDDAANALSSTPGDTDADYPWIEFSPTIADYSAGVSRPLTGVSG